jgi:hypothetical protein
MARLNVSPQYPSLLIRSRSIVARYHRWLIEQRRIGPWCGIECYDLGVGSAHGKVLPGGCPTIYLVRSGCKQTGKASAPGGGTASSGVLGWRWMLGARRDRSLGCVQIIHDRGESEDRTHCCRNSDRPVGGPANNENRFGPKPIVRACGSVPWLPNGAARRLV